MKYGLNLKTDGKLDLVSFGALKHRVDFGTIPFGKATERKVHPSGGIDSTFKFLFSAV